MHCQACGHDNPDDAAFCGDCGTALRLEVSCASCGRINAAGLKSCHGCGVALPNPQAPFPFDGLRAGSNPAAAQPDPREGGDGDGLRRKAVALLDGAMTISRELGMRPLMERVLSRREILKA